MLFRLYSSPKEDGQYKTLSQEPRKSVGPQFRNHWCNQQMTPLQLSGVYCAQTLQTIIHSVYSNMFYCNQVSLAFNFLTYLFSVFHSSNTALTSVVKYVCNSTVESSKSATYFKLHSLHRTVESHQLMHVQTQNLATCVSYLHAVYVFSPLIGYLFFYHVE